ncbi:hypothetical protein [Massilia sp. erpn]|uniref:hypothetical protein n=1 Tax=Massilia sp. erpn TaxID=2738142 RepID=UPI002107BCDA|nr:hypothetical protein [Massilia sp. erpn]UTY59473.1 hypothetical protein HPQ68_21225 [Massilia sp. erpn]
MQVNQPFHGDIMEIRVTHQGRVLHEIEITHDAQVHVRSLHPSAEYAGMPPAAQYVWGLQAATAQQPAAQYVWGSQASAAQPPAAQYVWGATNHQAGGMSQAPMEIDRGDAAPCLEVQDDRRVAEGLLKRPAK